MADVTIYTKVTRNKALNPSNPPDTEETPPVINPNPNLPPVAFLTLTDVTNSSYLGNNGFVPVVTNESGLTLQPLPQVEQNGLVSGGIVQWTGTGYVFNVSGAYYRIQGTLYSSDATQKTLSTPDATNNRIDVFAVDNTGLVVVIEGTPSATPVKPQIDPLTQLELTSVIVTASSTEPTLTEELIYDENVEWTGTSSGTGTANFASTNDPYQGTVSVETTNIEGGFYIQFNNGSEIDISTYQTIGFQINLKESMPANQNLYLSFLDGASTSVSHFVPVSIDKSLVGSYQFIGIALNTVNFTSNDVQYIRLSFVRTGGSPVFDGYFLDVLKLEGGINPPITIGSFLGLQDTPSSYIGFGGYTVVVKADESGLEFVAAGGGASTFLALTDTPSSYSGQAGLFPRVNGGETALEFDSVSPYDLDQEGATDGQVLTWVDANSRYEPVTPSGGSGLWTDATSFIYRNGPVLVGSTSRTDTGANFEVSGRISQVDLGNSVFIGEGAGQNDDLTTNNNVFIGYQAGQTTVSSNGSVGIGYQALNLSTSNQNTALGYRAARRASTGNSFVSIGFESGDAATTASRWVAIGWQAALSNTTGGFFTAIGYQAARVNTTGARYVALGYNAGLSQQTGNDWVAIGNQSGQSNNGANGFWVVIGSLGASEYSGGTTAATTYTNGVYIGYRTRVGGAGATNEIVIGYRAEGLGSNTAVIGNTSITNTYLRGVVNMSGLPTSATGLSSGDLWNNAGVINIV